MKRIWIIALLLFVAGRAAADDARELARRHFGAGEAKYKAGDYRGAILEFMAADALVPSPILAYNVALAHDKLGEAPEAVKLYRDYLARRPDAPNRGEVEARIAELEAAARPPAPAPTPMPPPPAPTPAPPPPAPRAALPPPPAPVPGPSAPLPSVPGTVDDGLGTPRVPPPAPAAGPPPERRAYDPAFGKRLPGAPPAPVAVAPAGPVAPPNPAPPSDGYPPSNAYPQGNQPIAQGGPPPGQAPPTAPPPGHSAGPYGGGQAQGGMPPGAPTPEPEKATPIYKQWWFWVVVGVSAVIVIDLAATSHRNTAFTTTPPSTGLTIFRF